MARLKRKDNRGRTAIAGQLPRAKGKPRRKSRKKIAIELTKHQHDYLKELKSMTGLTMTDLIRSFILAHERKATISPTIQETITHYQATRITRKIEYKPISILPELVSEIKRNPMFQKRKVLCEI